MIVVCDREKKRIKKRGMINNGDHMIYKTYNKTINIGRVGIHILSVPVPIPIKQLTT